VDRWPSGGCSACTSTSLTAERGQGKGFSSGGGGRALFRWRESVGVRAEVGSSDLRMPFGMPLRDPGRRMLSLREGRNEEDVLGEPGSRESAAGAVFAGMSRQGGVGGRGTAEARSVFPESLSGPALSIEASAWVVFVRKDGRKQLQGRLRTVPGIHVTLDIMAHSLRKFTIIAGMQNIYS
jgi:hypothetical protein